MCKVFGGLGRFSRCVVMNSDIDFQSNGYAAKTLLLVRSAHSPKSFEFGRLHEQCDALCMDFRCTICAGKSRGKSVKCAAKWHMARKSGERAAGKESTGSRVLSDQFMPSDGHGHGIRYKSALFTSEFQRGVDSENDAFARLRRIFPSLQEFGNVR